MAEDLFKMAEEDRAQDAFYKNLGTICNGYLVIDVLGGLKAPIYSCARCDHLISGINDPNT